MWQTTYEGIIKERESYTPPTAEQALEWFHDDIASGDIAAPTSLPPPPDLTNRKHLKFLIDECNNQLQEIGEQEVRIKNISHNNLALETAFKDVLTGVYVTTVRENVMRHLRKYTVMNPKKKSTNGVSAQEIQRAKGYPITNLIDFRHLTACCVWHTEDTPSMHYYKKTNTVWCFGCNRGGDAIDVHMTINNCDFLTSVKALQ